MPGFGNRRGGDEIVPERRSASEQRKSMGQSTDGNGGEEEERYGASWSPLAGVWKLRATVFAIPVPILFRSAGNWMG